MRKTAVAAVNHSGYSQSKYSYVNLQVETMRYVAYWWIFFWLQVAAYGLAAHFGVFHMIEAADVSRLSYVIIALHAGATLWVGYNTLGVARFGQQHEYHHDSGWFFSEVAMIFGMIGTIAGFIFTLVATLGTGIDPSQLNQVVADLAKGIGTAGWTTLLGLIASFCIKVQMNNLEALETRDAKEA